jgi:hypothetical protein
VSAGGAGYETCRACRRTLLLVAGRLCCCVRGCELYGSPQPVERADDDRGGDSGKGER